MAIPEPLSFSDAAAIPEAFLTAWDALVTRGRLQAGERVLIHAVGSGVGTAAVQLAKQLGATTAGTSRNPDKLARAAKLGLDESIHTGDSTSGGEAEPRPYPIANVIIDVLGGGAFAANLAALAPRGRLVMLGHLQGAQADASLDPILRKRLEVIGSVMRTRPIEERIPLVAGFSAQVLPWFATGQIRPIVGASYPMKEIAEAHRAMEADENFGKIVLTWE
jgi:NADPH:quinone reductase